MIKFRILEVLFSLLFGAALFYCAAPADKGNSFFPILLELKPLLICFGIWLVLSGLITSHFVLAKWSWMLFFWFIGMLIVVSLFPIRTRLYYPPQKVVTAATEYLDGNNYLYTEIEAIRRERELFDPFRPHYWRFVVRGERLPSEIRPEILLDQRKVGDFYVYVRESFWGTLDIKRGRRTWEPESLW